MSTAIKELFHQGVVTARDPSMLNEGEVAVAEDCIYRPNDPAIWKATGRTAYGNVISQSYTAVVLSGTTAAGAFGTVISTTVASGSTAITAAAGFTAQMVGYRVSGTNITVPTYVRSFASATAMTLDRPAVGTGSVNLLFTPIEPGDFIAGVGIPLDTTVLVVTDATHLTTSVGMTAGTVNVSISPSIREVLYLSFPKTSTDQILAYAGSHLYKSNYIADDGTFTSFLTGLSNSGNETMEVVRIGNKYALIGQGNVPRAVFFKDNGSGTDVLSSRLLGMQPVTTFSATLTTANSWPSALGIGTYYFLITEVYNAGQPDEIEGTYAPPKGTPLQYVTITDVTTQSVTVTRGPVVNTGTDGLTNAATHWRIYMSPSRPLVLPAPAFHLFRQVGGDISVVGPTTSQSYVLSDVNPVTAPASGRVADNNGGGYAQGFFNQAGFLGAANQMSGTASFGNGAVTGTFTIGSGTPTFGMPIYGTNLAYGTTVISVSGPSPFTVGLSKPTTGASSGTYFLGPSVSVDSTYAYDSGVAGCAVRISNFGFKNVGVYSGKIVIGVVVRVNYLWKNLDGSDDAGNDRGFNVHMTVGGSDTNTKFNIGHASGDSSTPSFGANRFGYINAGSTGETWGRAWNTGLQDLVDGNFFVHIVKAGSAIQQLHMINGVEVIVYFSGADVNTDGKPFPTVIFTTQVGEEVAIGAAGPPPPCDTGDIIDGQFVVNDTSNIGLVWASRPDDYEMFNPFYQLNVNGNSASRVMVIRHVGGVGVLFCRNAIKCLNYFPTEEDTYAQRGRAWQDISSDHGVASKRGVTLFDMPGHGVIAAYVAPHGLMATNGIQTWPLNVDLDWANTVEIPRLDTCKLVNYPTRFCLVLYYTPTGDTYPTKSITFYYHPGNIKKGNTLAALGPNQARAAGAVRTNLGNSAKLLTGNLSDGRVYLEDNTNLSEDTNVTIMPRIRSRLIYANDVGGQARIEQTYLRVGAAGDATTGACQFTPVRQNIGEGLTKVTLNDEPNQGAFTTDATAIPDSNLILVWPDVTADAFQLEIRKDDLDAEFRLLYATMYGTGYGKAKTQ